MSAFDAPARDAFYEIVARRRDIRSFVPGQLVPEEILGRILQAADQAPSVGFSQPWDFILVRDARTRVRIRESFLRCREVEASRFPPERRAKYLSYKLEGIVDSALNICVTVDLRPSDEPVLGTTAQPDAIRWSACCAVQNLWLAARAEGIGVGWVSIVEPSVLRTALDLPRGVEPIAYLCVGYATEFRERPLLEETGWSVRRPLARAIHEEAYGGRRSRGRADPVRDSTDACDRRHMPWVKIPKENHAVFRDALPKDARISTVNLFGGVAAKVNGQMFAGLFGRGAIVKLSPEDQQTALALDGTAMFDPMSNGRVMRDTVFLPDSVMDDQSELRDWLRKALEYTATLPRKRKPATPKTGAASRKNKTAPSKMVAKQTTRRRA
jgi:5,6-dimethylbenzimidazole synthase